MNGSDFTAEEVLNLLQEGNARYVAGSHEHPNLNEHRRTSTSSNGQTPLATILACSDSRVPVEYAVEHLRTPIFAVLGHTQCGAVTAVVKSGLLQGNLRSLSERILPAVKQAKQNKPEATEEQLVLQTVKAKVWTAIEDAFKTSECLQENVRSHGLKVLGAVYDIHSGKVEWLGVHPKQDQLLA
jgi:carbonic anhydrase